MTHSKAIVVTYPGPGLTELNRLLADGWQVSHTCAMPSSAISGSHISATCLVVVQKFITKHDTV
jgi:hypothetical protein